MEHHHEEEHHHNGEEHHHHEQFSKGDRISYKDRTGTVSRINILGLTPCCAVQITWDNSELKSILHSKELKEVEKL